MAPRTLPGLGLRGFWDLGEDGWNDEHDEDLRKLSALAQPVVLSRVTALPGSPVEGDIYIVPDGAGSNPNEIAIYDNATWVYLVPAEGWTAYVVDDAENVQFDGTDWVAFAAGVGVLDDLTDVNAPTPADGDVLTWDGAEWTAAAPTGGVGSGTSEWTLTLAASDETTDLTTGDSKITFFMPTDVTMTEVFTAVSGQSSSGDVTIDIRLNGSTIFSTPPSVNASEDTSLTGTVAVLSTTAFVKGDKVEIDIDAAGTGASGLKVTLIGTSEGGGSAIEVLDEGVSETTALVSLDFVGAGVTAVDDSSGNVTVTISGGGGGVWQLQWGPLQNEAPATNYATLDTRNSRPVLDFDTTTQEAAVFTGVLPADYGGGGITVSLWCSMTSATSGTVGWTVSIERTDASGLDIDADSFATAQTVTAVTVPGTSGQVIEMSVNISDGANMDSLAAGELFRIKVARDVANDTATGDAELLRVMMVEQ